MTDNGARDSVVIERSFDDPIDLVWRMWTDPDHFRAWFGPDGVTIPVAKLDVRVGGSRLVCMEMQSPEGPAQMWFTGEFLEVVANERLVYTESVSDESGNLGEHPTTQITVELSDDGGRTTMVMTHAGVPADSPGAAGWTMAFAKLAAHIERSITPG